MLTCVCICLSFGHTVPVAGKHLTSMRQSAIKSFTDILTTLCPELDNVGGCVILMIGGSPPTIIRRQSAEEEYPPGNEA